MHLLEFCRYKIVRVLETSLSQPLDPIIFVDAGKQSQTESDYLVACTSTLQDICKKQGNFAGNRIQLAQGIYWHRAYALFESCSCPNSAPCERGQVLYSRSLFGRVLAKKQPDLFSEPKGAVIFGRNRKLNIIWPDVGEPSLDVGSNELGKDPDVTAEQASIEGSGSPSLGSTSSSPMSTAGTSATSVTSELQMDDSSVLLATSTETQNISLSPKQSSPLQKSSPDPDKRKRKSTQAFSHRAKRIAPFLRR
jgi:hypothetical protein